MKEAYLLWNPGEGFAYSNIGYEFLGVIIASISECASFWICPQLELSFVVCSNISGAPVKK